MGADAGSGGRLSSQLVTLSHLSAPPLIQPGEGAFLRHCEAITGRAALNVVPPVSIWWARGHFCQCLSQRWNYFRSVHFAFVDAPKNFL